MADDPYSIFSTGAASPTPSAAPAPVENDPFSIFQAGKVAPPAQTQISHEEIQKSKAVGDFLVKPLDAIVADDTFDPVSAYSKNVFGDDESAKKKILEVFKARELRGIEFGKAAGGFVKGVASLPSAVADSAGTIASELTNVAEGVSNGNKDRTASALGDLGAGVHTNLANLKGLVNRGLDKFGQVTGLDKAPATDRDWEKLLLKRAGYRDEVEAAARGDVGGIREATERAGGSINAEAAQSASTLLDPTIAIPVLAGAKAARAGAAIAEAIEAGGAAGKATEAMLAANKGAVSKAAGAVAGASKEGLATGLEKAGGLATAAGEGLEKIKGGPIGTVIGGVAGAITGGPVGAITGAASGVLAPKAIRAAGSGLTGLAGKLRGTVPPGPIWKAVSEAANSNIVKGTLEGAAGGLGLTGDPLAAAFSALGVAGAENSEQVGEALGGQAGFGAAAGGIHGTAKTLEPFFDIAGQVYDPKNPSKPINSPAYGTAAEVDGIHQAAIAKLNPEVQNRINQFREAVRSRGAEIYVLDPDNFGRSVEHFFAQEAEKAGGTLTNEQLAAIRDTSEGAAGAKGLFVNEFKLGNQKKKVVFLNADGAALQHEGGHLLFSLLDAAERKALASEVRKRYSADELSEFKKSYEERLGERISENDLVNEVLAENISAVLNAVPVETLGTPKPLARSIYQSLGKFFETAGVVPSRTTDLGLRPDFGLGSLAENVLRAQEQGARPVIKEAAKVDLTKVDLNAKPAAKVEAPLAAKPITAPGATPPGATPPPATPAAAGGPPLRPRPDNIRVGREDQNKFQRAISDEALANVAKAVDANPNYGPQQKAAFVKLGAVISQGGDRPRPVEIDYSAAKSKEFQAGRSTRRSEQTDTYVKEAAGALPEHVRQLTQKVLIPERFEVRSDNNVQLVAKSLDKVVANAYILTKDAHKNGAADLVPYANKDGALTDAGWQDLVEDIQHYTANQSNGYAGNGSTVNVPAGYKGVIPETNANFKPIKVNTNSADFINMLMALPPPKTTSKVGVTASGTPANLIARDLATANNKTPLRSVTSTVGKDVYEGGTPIAEFNPLRDRMAQAGVKVRDLLEVTERVNLQHIDGDVKVRNDLDFSRPSTDLIRAGFMPDPKKAARTTNHEVKDIADEYVKKNGISSTGYSGYEKLSTDLGTRLADWYDGVKSAPNDPVTRMAYEALADQVKKQYQAVVDAGYTIEPWTEKGEPYRSSADMAADVRENKHLWFFPTDNGFGSGQALDSANPMLKSADVSVNGKPLVINDLFRAIHDFFGHAKEGYEFGPRGEYNSFLSHSTMFTPDALPALAAETLAQNAWVNHGQHLRRPDGSLPVKGDPDFVPLQNRPFAEQKVVAVPQDLLNEALASRNSAVLEKAGADRVAMAKAAIADPKTVYQYNVWDKEYAKNGNRVLQVDMLSPDAGDRGNHGSSNLDILRALGKQLPDAPDSLPPGRYTLDEIKAAIEKEKSQVPAGSFMPKISEKNKPLVDAIGGKEIRLIHLSGAQGLKELSTKAFGKGMATPTDLRGSPKIFFFEEGSKVGGDGFWTKGRQAYGAKVDGSKIYDATTDNLGWQDQMNREKADTMLKDAGYDGLRIETSDGRKVIALFKDTKVTPLGEFKSGSKVKIPETAGNFMPGDIYIGEVLEDGEVKSKRGTVADSHEKFGFKNGVRWRYSPETEKVYYWGHEKPSEAQRESVAASLEKKGFSVEGVSMLDVNDWKNFDRVYNEAHGAVPAGSFKPKTDATAEMDLGENFTAEKLAAKVAKNRIADKKSQFPEALPVSFVKNEDGSLRLDEDNKPQTVKHGYDLYDTPLAKAAAKGIRGDEARESAVADAYADKLVEHFHEIAKDPAIMAGSSWYQTARTKIKEVFGDDSLLFAQLLGATSARTPVADNFRQSIDAYRKFKAGDYDKIVKKYQQGLAKIEDGSLMKDSGESTEAAALDWWVRKHDLTPRKSNGQRFNANSMQVLKVLAGTWADTVGGPKTPNFAGNLAGTTLAATIDVWAARNLRRLGSDEGSRWRILPESETGVSDPDFFLGQAAYERAAKKLKMNPDDLQGVLWFAEKDHWEKKGWTRGSGAEKSDFNSFLKKTSKKDGEVVLDESEKNAQPELF